MAGIAATFRDDSPVVEAQWRVGGIVIQPDILLLPTGQYAPKVGVFAGAWIVFSKGLDRISEEAVQFDTRCSPS